MANAKYRLHRLPDVKEQTGLGRSAIYQRIKAGTFPAPIKLGARTVAWLSDDLDAWVEQQIAASKVTA
ncbi:MAG: helix-turn-helix transcriptional regulator [Betaproteobacteria bacterium]